MSSERKNKNIPVIYGGTATQIFMLFGIVFLHSIYKTNPHKDVVLIIYWMLEILFIYLTIKYISRCWPSIKARLTGNEAVFKTVTIIFLILAVIAGIINLVSGLMLLGLAFMISVRLFFIDSDTSKTELKASLFTITSSIALIVLVYDTVKLFII